MDHFYSRREFFSDDFPFHVERFRHTPDKINASVLHRRDFWKIAYVLFGECEFIVNDRRFPCQAGTAILSHPDSRTSFHIISGQMGVCNVLFLPELIAAELAGLEDNFDFFSIFLPNEPELTELYVLDEQKRLWPIIEDLEREYRRREANHRTVIRMRLVELLAVLARASVRRFRSPSTNRIVDYIDRWIERGFRRKLDLDALADDTGVGKTRLCLLYRRARGQTIMGALRGRRLAEARALLTDSDAPIIEVCHRAGFSDLSHFYHCFARDTGLSPAEYRRRGGHKSPLTN